MLCIAVVLLPSPRANDIQIRGLFLILCSVVFAFQAFKQLLQAPHDDAEVIIRERFPVPRLVVCDQHGSQVRTFMHSPFVLGL